MYTCSLDNANNYILCFCLFTNDLVTHIQRFLTTAVDCGPLSITNGQVVTPSGTTFMSTATYSCDNGYELNGTSTITCSSNGMWTPAAPICDRKLVLIVECPLQSRALEMLSIVSILSTLIIAIDCGALTDPANGQVDTFFGTTFTQIAIYDCNSGYTLRGGQTTRTCTYNGAWSLSAPICDRTITCFSFCNIIS